MWKKKNILASSDKKLLLSQSYVCLFISGTNKSSFRKCTKVKADRASWLEWSYVEMK